MAVFEGLFMKGVVEKDAVEQNNQPTNPWIVIVVYLLSLLYKIGRAHV